MYQITVSDPQSQTPGVPQQTRSPILTLAGLAILVVLAMGAPCNVAAQSAPLVGNHPALDATAMRSRADASRMLSIHISFAPRNPARLAKLLADLQDPASPRYHRWLSPATFDANFGRTPGEVSAIRQWLSGQGFRIVDSSPRGITSIATVAQAESAFATPLLATADGSLFANATDPQVPARLAGLIGSIEGLDNVRHSLAMACGCGVHARLRLQRRWIEAGPRGNRIDNRATRITPR